jgi:glycosyltransferase involved in cell wall biosynthesis
VEKSKQNTLILITNHFPYGGAEAFLESEIGFLTDRFQKVIVVPRDIASTGKRAGNFDVHRINPESNWKELVLATGLYFRHFTTVLNYFRTEVQQLQKARRKISPGILKVMTHDLTKAMITGWHLTRIIKKNNLQGTVVLYTYWLASSALAITFVKAEGVEIKRISRAHGGDVYEYRNPLKYLSFRATLAKHLDRIFTISESARQHLSNSVGSELAVKIQVSRLGTRRPASLPVKGSSPGFLVVSCSYMVPVKRIHLLIDALSLLTIVPVKWIHIGDGPQREDIERYAFTKLSTSSVQYELKGALSNEMLIRFYEENFVDLFVNTSEAEGVPVTMMEVQSFGIPVLAPAVGGVPEIISFETGRLFSAEASAAQISASMQDVLTLPPAAYAELRTNARRNWETRFNADHNFPTFVTEIFKLIQ